MIERIVLVCLVASIGVVGCGSSDGGGTGGEAGGGGAGGTAGGGGDGGGGGTAGGGGGGDGGMGGEGGAAGDGGPTFTSSRDWTDAGLAYQLERCQCQGPGEPISQSACLALAANLPFSDRQDECFDAVIQGEEQMTFENRLDCLIDVDFMAVDCLAEVNECSESAITDCVDARAMGQINCPRPHADVIPMISPCLATMTEDGVDAFLDSRSARCDCLTTCTSTDEDPEVVQCMMDTLQAEFAAHGLDALKCITKFWRQTAVCLGNEATCDPGSDACIDLPLMVCAISGTVLDDCLAL
jgi:hypothetical protein